MAGSAFDSFLDPFFDGDVFFSGSVSGNSYSDPDPSYSSPLAESSLSLTDGNAMNDFDRFLDSFNFDGVDSCLGPTQKSESLPIEQPFVCGFRHCCFKTPSWDVIVDHMGTTHFLATVAQSNCWCRTCGYVFGRKQVRDRHRINQHRSKRFFCPDCLQRSPFSRRDNYTRHRRLRHHEQGRLVSSFLTEPPAGYCGPTSSSNTRNVDMDFILVSGFASSASASVDISTQKG